MANLGGTVMLIDSSVSDNNASEGGGIHRSIARPQGTHCDIGAVEVVHYDRIFADNFDGTPTP